MYSSPNCDGVGRVEGESSLVVHEGKMVGRRDCVMHGRWEVDDGYKWLEGPVKVLCSSGFDWRRSV